MSAPPQDLRGLAIAIYATLIALLAWVTWIVLTTARRRTWTRARGATPLLRGDDRVPPRTPPPARAMVVAGLPPVRHAGVRLVRPAPAPRVTTR